MAGSQPNEPACKKRYVEAASRSGGRNFGARAGSDQSGHPGHWRHHRHRNLHTHGRSGRDVRRPGRGAFIHHRRHRLRFRGALLRGIASMIPISGSAYTYSYATLGELIAWIIGWALVLECAFGAATVAVGWSGYMSSLLGYFGLRLPFNPTPSVTFSLFGYTIPAHVDIFAMTAIVIITAILVIGVKESANFNSAAVIIKVSVVLLFIGIAL